jgi:hypothetical protein
MMRATALTLLSLTVMGNAPAAPIVLVPNRAIYELSLAHTSAGGTIAAHGRIVIEFRDVCDGWTTTQRMLADMTDADGKVARDDFLVTAWESKTGREMRFDITNSVDGKLIERQRGRAKEEADSSGTVELAEPKVLQFALPKGTEFPTGQAVDILQAGLAAQTSAKAYVFQGGDKSALYLSTVLIGRKVQDAQSEHPIDKTGLVKNVSAWPVLVSYFPNEAQSETPDYEVASRLYANGVIGSMSLIYSNYTLKATLTQVEPLPPAC